VQGFRSLADGELELPEAGCVVAGPNGSGKSSLIEALLYGEVFRSMRGATDRELVKFDADGFHVRCTVSATGNRQPAIACGYDARTKQKKVTIDGAVPERLADAIGMVRGVVLSPGDVSLVAGGPRERRRFLDVLLSLAVPGYVDALGRYRRALAQRLKGSPQEMPAWERVLAENGRRIAQARCDWAARWASRYAELCLAIGERDSSPGPHMEYRERAGDWALLEALEHSREKDRERGRTSVGPHRDELRLQLGGRDLRAYGSAGQQRTAAMALRMVEAETLESTAGGVATLCLDDAFAELDEDRSRKLGLLIERQVERGWQVVAAVPKERDIPMVLRSLPTWTIGEGAVRT